MNLRILAEKAAKLKKIQLKIKTVSRFHEGTFERHTKDLVGTRNYIEQLKKQVDAQQNVLEDVVEAVNAVIDCVLEADIESDIEEPGDYLVDPWATAALDAEAIPCRVNKIYNYNHMIGPEVFLKLLEDHIEHYGFEHIGVVIHARASAAGLELKIPPTDKTIFLKWLEEEILPTYGDLTKGTDFVKHVKEFLVLSRTSLGGKV